MILTVTSCSFNNKTKVLKNDKQVVNTKEHKEIPSSEQIVKDLCSKEFEGRLVGSKGNDKARDYIVKIFKELELEPFIENDYYHKYYERVSNYSQNNRKNEFKTISNVVGVIKGKDRHSGVVISAHFDHLGYQNGKLIPGALDNASGIAALIQISKILKEKSKNKPFDMDIILCGFNSEEIGRTGSRNFVNDIQGMYYNLYNINIDCVGGKQGGKLALKNISKVSAKLYDTMKNCMKKNEITFSNTRVKGGSSDYKSFENSSIPNINIGQENIKKLIHKPTDTPDILNYEQIGKISNAICDFIENNNGKVF